MVFISHPNRSLINESRPCLYVSLTPRSTGVSGSLKWCVAQIFFVRFSIQKRTFDVSNFILWYGPSHMNIIFLWKSYFYRISSFLSPSVLDLLFPQFHAFFPIKPHTPKSSIHLTFILILYTLYLVIWVVLIVYACVMRPQKKKINIELQIRHL